MLRLLIASGLLFLIPALGSAADWDAARDLKNNELLGLPQASINPNPTVTNWSYGWRAEASLAATSLTLYTPDQHVPSGSPDLRGWARAIGPGVLINATADPIVLSFCCGPLLPINPGEMDIFPGSDTTASVVRWVAPATANYDVMAYWQDSDPHGGNGAAGSIVVDGKILFSQAFPNGGGAGYTNTAAFSAGAVVDFVLGPNGDYSYDSTSFNAKLTMQPLGPLPAIDSVSASPGGAPIRSSNPWTFTATYSTLVSDLRLRVQSTDTTNNEASWTDLHGNPYMTHSGANWTLNTTDVPTGNRYFRVVASAPFYTDATSTFVMGPFTVLDGIAPFGDFSWETSAPAQTGLPWIFSIVQPSLISALHLRVQSSLTPSDPNAWNDLPGGGQMGQTGSTWILNTTNPPTGSQSFRVVASAPTYIDRISAVVGPFDIQATLPFVTKAVSTSGKYSLLDIPETQSPSEVFLTAVSQATVQFGLPFNLDLVKLAAAISLAAQQYAAAQMQILPSQTLTVPALNAGPGATVELKGTIIGDLSLNGAGLLGDAGAQLIGYHGAELTHDLDTAAIIHQDGAGLIGDDGAGIIHQDGAGIIHQDGAGVVAPGAGNVVSLSVARLRPARQITTQGLGPTQPAFTGLLTVNGNYRQFAGTLAIGIAGTNATATGAQQYDQLVVSGTADLFGGTIAVRLFNPDDQTNQTGVFQPPSGAIFDVLVASNIVVSPTFELSGRIWGEGLFFEWALVTRPDGLQALRLMATPHLPPLKVTPAGALLRLSYPTNYSGYTVESSPTFSPTNWTAFSTGTNIVTVSPTNASRFFRLSKP
ncbi:MAG: hypothetical protein ACYDH9_23520 [Limisphaerales bacterium]